MQRTVLPIREEFPDDYCLLSVADEKEKVCSGVMRVLICRKENLLQ